MVKSAVRVVVRTRPTNEFASDVFRMGGPSSKAIDVHLTRNPDGGLVNNQQEDWKFTLDAIMHNASQEAVFSDCGVDVVNSVLDGYNGTVMTYGQTGAGKTFTMTGGTESYAYRGVIPRSVAHIFNEVAARTEQSIVVRVSYLEIYNEMMIDLLSEHLGDGVVPEDLVIMEDSNGVTKVKGLSSVIANNEEEALNLFFEGEMNRNIARHTLNVNSTRSHCIFTVHLEMRSRIESSEKVIRSKLNLVDLAGSERVKKTHSEGTVLKEALYINKSLTFLEQVVLALGDRNREHIPYRQTKLTNVLKDSLGGNCKTTLIANIWPEKRHVEETVSTLKFAMRMMRVSNEATKNVEYDPLMLVKKYEREIKDLKQELAMHDTLVGRSFVSYDAYSDEQRMELRKEVKAYLDGEKEEIEVVNLRQVNEIFNQFKQIYKNIESSMAESFASRREQSVKAGGAGGDGAAAAGGAAGDEGGIGDVEAGDAGFGVGLAPPGARPAGGSGNLSPTAAQKSGSAAPRKSARSADDAPAVPAPNKADLFLEYKAQEGAEANESLEANKRSVKEKKSEVKQLSVQVNESKRTIDRLNKALSAKQALRESQQSADDEDAEIIDEEEFAYIKDLKVAKKEYRTLFDALRVAKSECDYAQRLVDQCRAQLLESFDNFYTERYGAADTASVAQSEVEDDKFMDDQEKFDRMELERIRNEDPDSVAFYNAQKTMKQSQKLKKTGLRKAVR
jgi:kinesin family member 6/9